MWYWIFKPLHSVFNLNKTYHWLEIVKFKKSQNNSAQINQILKKSKIAQEHIFLLTYNITILARTPEIEQALACILSCGACKPEQTYMDQRIIVDAEPPSFFMTY